ncbi:MAG: hypothetical protein N3E45_16225 [Oscillatoriaceae bacterium SKW80]|nr:hypothetical protein [Oscillatoriaceae bacterium SKYG93]MCX8122345.1 hypothetical protein [Oscillatoriaceae bacterium SKW80]MDW8452453.1 hypothetical protein [Oscillatoriaceae cyanobacterium SKYGB_i_bin93]HIK27732.1 hypothetical protein [Oscillatoriaceae cyanobacterium M7585_C2015_266]
MTITAVPSIEQLGQILQERLQLKFFPNGPLQIKCARREGTLMILGQHPRVVVPDSQQIFAFLEQTVQGLRLEWMQKVELYLRVANEKYPYAFHSFTFATAAAGNVSEEITDKQENTELLTGDIWDLSEQVAKPQESSEEVVSQPRIEKRSPIFSVESALVAGASVTLVMLLVGLYFLNRPCVIGRCKEIQRARQLAQDAVKIIKGEQSQRSPLQAKAQLNEANELLRKIPFWSFYYQEAQGLLQTYEKRAENLAKVIEIQKKGAAAAEKSKNPPHSVETWQDIQSDWRAAIALLEEIPADSELDSWRERKLQEYRANLKAINQRVKTEQLAQKLLKSAKTAARLAEARQGVAQSLESWQLVQATWQTAVKLLSQIPKGTLAEQEAKQLLENYRLKLAESGNRQTTEQMALNTYNRAISAAEQAQKFEQKNQWSQAVKSWRQALSLAQQVPETSNYYLKAQSLVTSYKNYLEAAQSKLQVAVNLQKARDDLKKTCSGSPKVCDYAVTSDLMTVYITSEYRRALRLAALTADKKRDFKTKQKVNNHVQTLQVALEAISNNAGIPISVYDPSGYLIDSYDPQQ